VKPEDIKKLWLLQNEIICICKSIPRKRFLAAITSGAYFVQEVNRLVGSGSGDCRGERCGPKIEALIAEYQAASTK
jgi:bacterioferritin-associated ferredoxin